MATSGKILYIIRGVPGSGKSTLAKQLAGENVCEADQFFYNDKGKYCYDPSKIREAHLFCQNKCEKLMKRIWDDPDAKTVRFGERVIAVANTFVRKREILTYKVMAMEYGYTPVIIICQNIFQNIHGVPKYKIDEMLKHFEY